MKTRPHAPVGPRAVLSVAQVRELMATGLRRDEISGDADLAVREMLEVRDKAVVALVLSLSAQARGVDVTADDTSDQNP